MAHPRPKVIFACAVFFERKSNIMSSTSNNFILSCCSTVDLSLEHLNERNIRFCCFHYFLDGKEYMDDLGQSMTFDEFYKAMENGADTKTSQINVAEFEEYFDKLLGEGKDVLHVSFSSGLSGTFNSARIAADVIRENHPNQKLIVVDSLAAASGYGLLMEYVADLRDAGASIDEAHDWILKNRLKLHHWFFSTDLTFYVKGGRVSKAAGWFGTALKICPLLNVSNEGKLVPREKIRTKPRVIKAVVDKMAACADDGENYSGKCYICHSACYDDARAVADLIEKRFPKLNGRVLINSIGTVIGSHTGPGTVAVFFMGAERID